MANGWTKVPDDYVAPVKATDGAGGWKKLPDAPKAVSAEPVTQTVQTSIAPTYRSEEPKPLSDEDASTYVAMTKDPNVHPEDVGNWLEGKGYLWTPEAAKELDAFRAQVAAGVPVQNEVGYRSGASEIIGPNTPMIDPTLDGGMEAAFEEGNALNPMGVATRFFQDITDAELQGGLDKDALRELFPALDDDGIEGLHDSILGEWRRRELENAAYQVDERDVNPVARFGANMVTGVSPVDMIPMGRAGTFAARLAEGAGYNLALDAGMQGQDMAYGAQDAFRPEQAAIAAAAGAGIQGGLEGLVRAGNRLINSGGRPSASETSDSDWTPVAEETEAPVQTPEPETPETSPAFDGGEVPSFLKNPVKAKGYGTSKPRKAAKAETPKALEDSGRGQNIREVEGRTRELTEAWTNAPEFLIVNNVDDLDDRLAAAITADRAEDAKGLVTPDGKVVIMSDNLSNPAEIDSVVFHEALGHVGLNTEFRGGLDDLLIRLDEGNENLRADVDAWIAQNPNAYEGSRARAVEEVLAEASEGGIAVPKGIMEQIRIYVSQWARRLGIKNEGYFGDAEVREILRMAHERVINGDKSVANIDGSRYIRNYDPERDEFDRWTTDRTETENELTEIRALLNEDPENVELRQQEQEVLEELGTIENETPVENRYMKNSDRTPSKLKWNPGKQKQRGMIGNVSGQRFKSKRAVHPILQEAADLAEDITPESFALWDQKAREMDMGLDEITNLNPGMSPSEAHAVGIALVTKGERVERLAQAIARGEATDKQKTDFGEAFLELSVIYEEYAKIANNAGRLLASFKIAKQSSSNQALRFMREDAEAAMRNPDGLQDVAEKIARGERSVGQSTRENSQTTTALANALNLPRTLMSSFDLSAPLRQGIVFSATPRFWKGFFQMFKYMGSQRAFDALQHNINNHPNYMKAREAGVNFTDTEGHNLVNLEEDFQSEWGKKIWVIGRGVKASERAFVGFLNKLRFDTFNKYMEDFERAGVDINDPRLLKSVGSFINAATGRGPIPKKYLGATPLLNGLFFSPRLNTSRIALLNPYYYGTMPAPVRKKAIKNMLGFAGVVTTTLTLASMGGADVELDTRSSDFGKIRVGTRRLDPMGGFAQFIVFGTRLIKGETKTIKGDVKELEPGIASDSRLDVLVRFVRSKLAPVTSFVADGLQGENMIGERFSVTEPFTDPPEGEEAVPLNKNALVTRLTPIYMQDVIEVMAEDGVEGLPWMIPPLFGIGYSDFDSVPSDSNLREENNPDNPAVKEVVRLATVTDKEIFGTPGKRVNLEGDGMDARVLTDEEHERYVAIADQYILEDIAVVIGSEEYDLYTDEEKVELLRDTAKESRKAARETLSEELFGDFIALQNEEESGEWTKVD